MPRRTRSTRLFVLALGLAIAPGPAAFAASPAPKDAMPATLSDPNAWLEDVTGTKPLAWVQQQNARTDAELAVTPGFAASGGARRWPNTAGRNRSGKRSSTWTRWVPPKASSGCGMAPTA